MSARRKSAAYPAALRQIAEAVRKYYTAETESGDQVVIQVASILAKYYEDPRQPRPQRGRF